MRSFWVILLIALVGTTANKAKADEVIVGYRHLSDPASLVYNGRVYLTGKLIGTINTVDAKNFKSVSCNINAEVTGKHDLFIVVKGSGTNPLKIDWWKFATK